MSRPARSGYCAMAGRLAARGSAAFPAARRFSLLDGYGWQFGERCHGEFGSRGGMRALLLPKPVIGWGADGVVPSGAGWCRSASDSVQQLPFDQGFLAFVLVGGLCEPLSHRRGHWFDPSIAHEYLGASCPRKRGPGALVISAPGAEPPEAPRCGGCARWVGSDGGRVVGSAISGLSSTRGPRDRRG